MVQSGNISEGENGGTWKLKEVIMEIPHWVFLFVGEIAFHPGQDVARNFALKIFNESVRGHMLKLAYFQIGRRDPPSFKGGYIHGLKNNSFCFIGLMNWVQINLTLENVLTSKLKNNKFL